MIKLRSVKKIFGKGTNKHVVLKDISLELPDFGLVAICGESGCGKTTLLNCIGGIDTAKGDIQVNGNFFGKLTSKTDRFRSKNIGYIYQDYELIESKSVKYNLQLAIDIAKTSSINDESRIHEVLEKVGMSKYIKRDINTLSGGQKQRVAIARAIINSPKILLADEPTGHLDTENTISVMKILSELSKQVLIVWVSHEKELVQAYADRIIRIQEGKIVSDILNNPDNIDSRKQDGSFVYLDQYDKSTVKKENLQIDVFSDQLMHSKIKLILSGNVVYIAAPQEYSIQHIPESKLKEQPDYSVLEDEKSCNNTISLTNVEKTGKRSKSMISFSNIFAKKNIVSLFGFVLAAIFMSISVSFGDFDSKENHLDNLQFHTNTIQIDFNQSFSNNDIEQIKSCSSTTEILPYNSLFIFQLKDGSFLQTSGTNDEGKTISACILDYSYAGKLIAGRLPSNSLEIILDSSLANNLLRDNNEKENVTMFGYISLSNFLNATLCLTNSDIELTVVGIAESVAPAIYVSQNMMTSLSLSNCIQNEYDIYTDYSLFGISKLSENEVYISERMYIEQEYSVNDEIEIAGKSFSIMGTHNFNKDTAIIMNSISAQELLLEKYYLNVITLLIMSENPESSIDELYRLGYNANSVVEINKSLLIYQQQKEKTVRRGLTIISIISAGIICFMTEKSKFSSRMDSIVVKRTLGVSKVALFFSFAIENLLEVSLFSIPAYFITFCIIENVSTSLGGLLEVNTATMINHFTGIISILVVAVIATMLSCFVFLNKTPAQLSKTSTK